MDTTGRNAQERNGMYRLTGVESEAQAAHAAKFGGYNDAPPNLKEVSVAEIVSETKFGRFSPDTMEYRQVRWPDGGWTAMWLYTYHDGTGVAMATDSMAGWHEMQGAAEKGEQPIRWFRFALCEHKFYEVSRPSGNRSGLHRDRCAKCGYEMEYDTSD